MALILIVATVVVVMINVTAGFNPLLMLLLVAVLLLPGRIQGRYWREFYQGRRLLDAGRPADALPHFDRFLQQLRGEPWRRRLYWLAWSVYTASPDAMTLNNIATAHLGLGQISEAEAALQAALALDPHYPLPYYNQAVMSLLRGDRPGAERSLQEAARLGYSAGTIDAVIHRAQSLAARIEGRSAKET